MCWGREWQGSVGGEVIKCNVIYYKCLSLALALVLSLVLVLSLALVLAFHYGPPRETLNKMFAFHKKYQMIRETFFTYVTRLTEEERYGSVLWSNLL